MFGGNVPAINWTNGPAPKVCSRCEPHKEYHVKLELQLLLPEDNEARVREAIDIRKEQIAKAIRETLNGRDAKLNKWTARAFKG